MTGKQLYLPAGEINEMGNGASKRSAQINNLLSNNFKIVNINEVPNFFFPRSIRYIAALKILFRQKIKIKTFRDFSHLGFNFLNCQRIVNDNNNPKFLFWESTLLNYHYRPLLFNELGCKLIAFPHNLESLVPNQHSKISKKPSPFWLDEELEQLRLCDHVFTISEEEQWFLTLNKIKSTYYPYYPTNFLENWLLDIRFQRKKALKENYYLIFGSFYYEPIGKGLLEVVKVLNNSNTRIIISGFASSERINSLDYVLNDNIKVVGETSSDELKELIIKCKGVIVNQGMSSGALTKLKELQIAGVPVILNNASTRSFKNIKGFYVFHDFDEFTQLLTNDLEMPELPSKNEDYNQRVIKIINNL
jgi:glycosyltransferase involved in cell wall biosynthesis